MKAELCKIRLFMRRKSQNIAFWQILRFWVLDIAGYSRLWYAWWSDHFAIKNFLVWWHDYLKLDIFCQEILKILIFDNLFDFDYMFDISDYYNEALEVEIVPLARCSSQLLVELYGQKIVCVLVYSKVLILPAVGSC